MVAAGTETDHPAPPDRPFCMTDASRNPAAIPLDAAFRAAMRRLAATVTVISTRADDGIRTAMTATAVTSVSVDPPPVVGCVIRSSERHAQLRIGHLFFIPLHRSSGLMVKRLVDIVYLRCTVS